MLSWLLNGLVCIFCCFITFSIHCHGIFCIKCYWLKYFYFLWWYFSCILTNLLSWSDISISTDFCSLREEVRIITTLRVSDPQKAVSERKTTQFQFCPRLVNSVIVNWNVSVRHKCVAIFHYLSIFLRLQGLSVPWPPTNLRLIPMRTRFFVRKQVVMPQTLNKGTSKLIGLDAWKSQVDWWAGLSSNILS